MGLYINWGINGFIVVFIDMTVTCTRIPLHSHDIHNEIILDQKSKRRYKSPFF